MNKIILILTLLYLTVSTEASLNNRATDPWKEMNKVLRNIKTPKFRNKAFLITDFGAKEGIEDYSNNSINKAINFCHSKGGGKVIVPKGVFCKSSFIGRGDFEIFNKPCFICPLCLFPLGRLGLYQSQTADLCLQRNKYCSNRQRHSGWSGK
jgi:hypothetical protein